MCKYRQHSSANFLERLIVTRSSNPPCFVEFKIFIPCYVILLLVLFIWFFSVQNFVFCYLSHVLTTYLAHLILECIIWMYWYLISGPRHFLRNWVPFCSWRSSWFFKMGPISCPATSVTNFQSTLRNIPEELRTIWSYRYEIFSFQLACLYLSSDIFLSKLFYEEILQINWYVFVRASSLCVERKPTRCYLIIYWTC
jgi:hypothetical protein